MEEFAVEEYLPCDLEEIRGIKKTRELPSENSTVFLSQNIEAIPMNVGFQLFTDNNVYFTESIDLFEKINGKKTIKYLEDKEELSEYYFYGLINFEDNGGKLKLFEVPQNKRNLYNKDTTWFSMVPTKLEFDITSVCNFECRHCSKEASYKKNPDDLTTDEIKSILNQGRSIGTQQLTLMGGEPTIHEDFLEIARYAKEIDYKTLYTSTNGWLVDDNMAKEMSRYFDSVQVSIHASDPDLHDEIVNKKGAFERARNAVINLKRYDIKPRVSFTVMKENVNEIEEMPEFAKELGADSIRFLRLIEQGRGKDLEQWGHEETSQLSNSIRDIYSNTRGINVLVGGFSCVSEIKDHATFYGCPAGRTMLYISSQGDVSCCGSIEEYVGNIRESSLIDLWHHEKMREIRETPRCICNYNKICGGLCRGNFEKPYEGR